METIWVLENVKKDYSFYSRLQILMLIASVSLWKKYHPNHKTIFYCDEMSNEVLSELDMFYLSIIIFYKDLFETIDFMLLFFLLF